MTCKRVMVYLSYSVCFLTSFANASVVYQSDFEQQGPGPEWLGASLTMTPAGCIRCTSFLGEFGNQFVTLDLGGLPAHLTVTLDFDLYVIRSWDGNLTQFGGPDIFRVLDGTQSLNFQTTFSNNYPFGTLFNQAFPGIYPGGVFPSQSDAVERQTLGYVFNANPIGVVSMDAVYHLSFSFAHSDPSLALSFGAENLSPLPDESWGVDNVVVSVSALPEPASIILLSAGFILLTAIRVLTACDSGNPHKPIDSGTSNALSIYDDDPVNRAAVEPQGRLAPDLVAASRQRTADDTRSLSRGTRLRDPGGRPSAATQTSSTQRI